MYMLAICFSLFCIGEYFPDLQQCETRRAELIAAQLYLVGECDDDK